MEQSNALATKYGAHVLEIVRNPEAHGYEWGEGELNKKGMVLTKAAPFIIHRDVQKMQATFGETYFLDCANGQSGRVRDQTLREDIWEDKSLASRVEEMRCIVISKALGTKRTRKVTVITKQIFVAEDGSEFETKEALLEYNKQNA